MAIKCAEVFQENVFSRDTACWRRCRDLLTAVSKGSTKAEEAFSRKQVPNRAMVYPNEDV